MRKKKTKRVTRSIIKKRKPLSGFFIRYTISICVVFFLVNLLYPFISSKPSIVCANTISCKESQKLKVENNTIGIFENKKVIPPQINLSVSDLKTDVLGAQTATGEKHIYVNLTTQTLSAYQGKTLFMQVFISSGKWHPTPTGNFAIWVKLRATRMTGGSGDDFYDLPNVPYVMFFSGEDVPESAGFSLHGEYWHNNLGHPMSHGCVNMRITDAQKLYNWVSPATDGYTTYATDKDPGTKVTIYGEAPI